MFEETPTSHPVALDLKEVEGSPANPELGSKETLESKITFLGKDVAGMNLHDNGPMVIKV